VCARAIVLVFSSEPSVLNGCHAAESARETASALRQIGGLRGPLWVIFVIFALPSKSPLSPRKRRENRHHEAMGIAGSLPPGRTNFDLLRDGQGIIDIDAQIVDGAINFCVAKKQLADPVKCQ
jgi:hypothetical protein